VDGKAGTKARNRDAESVMLGGTNLNYLGMRFLENELGLIDSSTFFLEYLF